MTTVLEAGLSIEVNEKRTGLCIRIPDDMPFTSISLASTLDELAAYDGTAGMGMGAVLTPTQPTTIWLPFGFAKQLPQKAIAELIENVQHTPISLTASQQETGRRLKLLFADERAHGVAIEPLQTLTAAFVRKDLQRRLERHPDVSWSITFQDHYLVIRLALNGERLRTHGQMLRMLPAQYPHAVQANVRLLTNSIGRATGRAILTLRPRMATGMRFDLSQAAAIKGFTAVHQAENGDIIANFRGRADRCSNTNSVLGYMAQVMVRFAKAVRVHPGLGSSLDITMAGGVSNLLVGVVSIREENGPIPD